jgi:regulator of ribonuclease activity A
MIRSICDLADDHRDVVKAVDPIFKDYAGLKSFHGPITTLRCFEDNLLLRQVLSTPGTGRVMVVDGGGSIRRALVGDKLAALMLHHDWAGVIVNGAVRDVENLRDMPVAIRALNVCPMKPQQTGSGDTDVDVTFAGVTFKPGAWLYADENGIIVSDQPIS